MNNPKSMMLGWGALIAAAGVGYIYARKDINERRREQAALGVRPTEKLDWKSRIAQPSGEKSEPAVATSKSLGGDDDGSKNMKSPT